MLLTYIRKYPLCIYQLGMWEPYWLCRICDLCAQSGILVYVGIYML